MEYNQVLRLLIGTRIGERISAVQNLYSKLDKAQKVFTEKFCIHCKEGCGTCCEHFNPDITTAEAEYIAMGLIFQGNDKEVLDSLHSSDPDQGFCPLYRKDNPFHCSIYNLRPLICRLFGASVVHDKNGDPVVRNCKWNDGATVPSSDELRSNSDALVVMSDYGMQLEEMQPEDTSTYPLAEAVERAIYKIRFMMQLDDDHQPEPEPNAS